MLYGCTCGRYYVVQYGRGGGSGKDSKSRCSLAEVEGGGGWEGFEGWGHQVDRGVSESGGVGLGSGAALLGWACTFGFRLRMPVAYSFLSLFLSFSLSLQSCIRS